MSRGLAILCLLLALSHATGVAQQVDAARGDARPPAAAAGTSSEAAHSSPDPTPDAPPSEDDLRLGRYWHASLALRLELTDSAAHGGSLLLSLARAEAGWERWDAVLEILRAAEWISEAERRVGWELLGRAHFERRQWSQSADAFELFLEGRAGGAEASRIRRMVALSRAGRMPEALDELDVLSRESSEFVAGWAALAAASAAVAERDDAAAALQILERTFDNAAAGRVATLLGESLLRRKDPAGAEDAFRQAASLRDEPDEKADLFGRVADLRLSAGDTAGAVRALGFALDTAPHSRAGASAAARLLDLEAGGADRVLAMARSLEEARDFERAAIAYRRHAEALGPNTSIPADVLLAHAGVMARTGDAVAAVTVFTELAELDDPAVQAAALSGLANAQRALGRTALATATEDRLIEEHPTHPSAVELIFGRGEAARRAGRLDEAMRHFRAVAELAASQPRAGRAWIYVASIERGRGRPAAAASAYEAYLDAFPGGRYWAEAAFWAARSREEAGDPGAARAIAERLVADDPFTFHAIQAAEHFGLTWDPIVPALARVPRMAQWVEEGMADLDVVREAGLVEAADRLVRRLRDRAGASPDARLQLAEGLNRRGFTWEGIDLGREVLSEGRPWDLRLLRVIYPFPFRAMVEREAAEWGLDPFLMAALIRQESAFWERAVSSAGAVGLMQVMPATGKNLARQVGPEGFHPAFLKVPDVNLHLGSAYLSAMLRRYDGDIPIVLSAYNAGPTRASRWRRASESRSVVQFAEWIPLAETRGYVRNVTRNRVIYGWLYGGR